MTRRMIPCLALLMVLSVLSSVEPARAREAGGDGPQVRTLTLDSPLRSWGRLGGITVDRLGFLYVSNFGERVWKILPDGAVQEFASGFYGASGNAVDGEGRLLQGSFFDNRIYRIGRDGTKEILAEEGLNGPVGMVATGDGSIYVCNCRDNSVSRVEPDGSAAIFARSEQFACPNGITMDDKGSFYVVSFSNDHIVRIGPDGATDTLATLTPEGGYPEPAAGRRPQGNAHIVFVRDSFYVTKIKVNTLYRVSLDGTYSLFAGTGEKGLKDGPLDRATLASPNGITAAGPVLIMNNIRGQWGTPNKAELVLRTINLSTP